MEMTSWEREGLETVEVILAHLYDLCYDRKAVT